MAGPDPVYGMFRVPAGFEAQAKVIGGGLMTMVHWICCVCAGFDESVTVTV